MHGIGPFSSSCSQALHWSRCSSGATLSRGSPPRAVTSPVGAAISRGEQRPESSASPARGQPHAAGPRASSQSGRTTPPVRRTTPSNPADEHRPMGQGDRVRRPAEGFESAVAVRVADTARRSRRPTSHGCVAPFDDAVAHRTARPYDFDINQVSFTPSGPSSSRPGRQYYEFQSIVVAREDSPVRGGDQCRPPEGCRSFGAPGRDNEPGAIQDVIKPTTEALRCYNSNDAARCQALEAKQIEGMRRRLADGVLPHDDPGAGRRDRRPARNGRRWRTGSTSACSSTRAAP